MRQAPVPRRRNPVQPPPTVDDDEHTDGNGLRRPGPHPQGSVKRDTNTGWQPVRGFGATGQPPHPQQRVIAPHPGKGGPLVAVVRTGPAEVSLPETLRNPLVIAALLTDHKAYVLPQVLNALRELQWDGDKVLHVTYNGRSRSCRQLVARYWEGPLTSIDGDVALNRDNTWHSGIVALLREETRQALLKHHQGATAIFWVDCDVVMPPHAVMALSEHGQAMASGVVPSRGQPAIIARDAIMERLIKPETVATEGLRRVFMTGFGCLLMRPDVLEKIHWLPEEMLDIVDGGGGEDDHACREAAEAGCPTYMDPQVLCTHYRDDRSGNMAVPVNGQRRLAVVPVSPTPIHAPARASQRSQKPKRACCVMTSVGCYGGTKVIVKMLEGMAAVGWDVSVCALGSWAEGAWTNWDFARRLTLSDLDAPYDLVIGNHHVTLPVGAKIKAKHHVALIQSDEPEWQQKDHDLCVRNFSTPGYKHVIISEYMRSFADKYGHDIVGKIDNGVDGLTFYPDSVWQRTGGHSLMFVRKSSRAEYTGEDVLEETVGLLAQRYSGLEVVVVGRSDKPRFTCKVRHVQTHSEAEMRRHYNSVTCFVRPSRVEGFPLVDLEAMACGTPIVVTPIGIDDAAVHEQDALFVPAGDAQAMADAVSRVFDEQDLRERLSRNGIRFAHGRTWATEQQQWLNIIEEVTGGDE